jgi:hypothetical protein
MRYAILVIPRADILIRREARADLFGKILNGQLGELSHLFTICPFRILTERSARHTKMPARGITTRCLKNLIAICDIFIIKLYFKSNRNFYRQQLKLITVYYKINKH